MNIFNDYEGFIFDLDGTLIDSVNIWRDIDEEFFKRRKIPEPEGFYATVSGLNLRQGAELVIERFNLDENDGCACKIIGGPLKNMFAMGFLYTNLTV